MPINTFSNESQYDSHTKSTTESELSLIEDINEVRYDGINVHVTNPKFGDALYIDSNNKKHFIDGDSLNVSLLPNTWTPVGVVVENENNQILISYYKGYNNGDNSVKWASAWIYDITATVDGTERSITFRQPKDSGYINVGTFTHSCSTQEEFAQALDTWLRENQGGTAADGTWNYNWHCEYMQNYNGVMKPCIIIDNMVDYRQYADNGIIVSGATASANMANNIPNFTESVGFPRKNGGSGYRTGLNLRRSIEYWSNNTTIANPTSMISVKSNNEIVSRSQFNNNEYCADLRTAYGTFEKYIESIMLEYPSLRRGLRIEKDKSLEWTKAQAGRQHKKLDGTLIYTFQAHSWIQNLSFDSDGLRQGEWFMPNVCLLYKLIRNITYGLGGVGISTADRFNKTVNKMSGNLVAVNQYRWSCVRNNYRSAWNFYSTGCVNSNSFYNAFRVSAFSHVVADKGGV